ncbi:AAA domain-containing protein [Planotetraspora sp. A-T 1434]|uniref:DEAD/DEAH box helicase n=1 Tax=Planotetraspora sp. A-T 1434 TaxID=2979219 RepID=UPI0021BFFD47|nr:AAA domain-containing protein [Planotetraspora sp. A-T 1434]MCT9934535.1 AAA domain-containing protein [Planotetraspora sp. A-T 1434]
MTALNEGRTRVIEFWRACELFTQQSIPNIDPRDSREPVFSITRRGPLPWEKGHPLRNRRIKSRLTWRHIVYGGVFPLQRSRDLLRQVFGPDLDHPDPPPLGEGALFAVVVSAQGHAVHWQVSSGAWAAGRTVSPGPAMANWLAGYDNECATICDRLRALTLDGNGRSRPLGHDDLARLVDLAAESLGVSDLLQPHGLRVRSMPVSRKREYSAEEGADLLNSFIARDLDLVAQAVRQGRYGAALDAYLSTDEPGRIDIRQDLQTMFDHVAPDLIPLGRWPARPDRPLTLSQQFAVSTIMDELSSGSGLFAVNGPPGTGKTTMLRDLIAANVVERALRLSRLPDPAFAFTKDYHWGVDEQRRTVSAWKEELIGFEMVIASANNGAVENVTIEIPGRDALDPPWRDSADYFGDIASAVLGQPAWGLVAARLGRKTNRAEFVGKAWYGSPERPGLLERLTTWESDDDIDWRDAVARFRDAYEHAQLFQSEKSARPSPDHDAPGVNVAIKTALRLIPATEKRLDRAREALKEAEQQLDTATDTAESCRSRHGEHLRLQPSPATMTGAALNQATYAWRTEDLVLKDRKHQANTRLYAAKRRVREITNSIEFLTAKLESLQVEVDDARTRTDVLQARQGRHNHARDAFLTRDELQRELTTPWTDEAWDTARSVLFIEALRLHQAFLRIEAPRMRTNLQSAMDVLIGTIPRRDVPEAAARAAWQSLFFVIPVISTTFASLGWMFSELTQESLGWLFVDEAGQAAPQQAIGAIWRARRVVTLGDPLQLEPVVPLSVAAQQALRRTFSVDDDRWLPGRTSVQRLADQRTAYGTFLPGAESPVWVGAPLRVHRRCDQPMFDVSNAIAYDGLMVYGKPQLPDLSVPPSKWIDVPSGNSRGHWLPAEGTMLNRVVGWLIMRGGIHLQDILVISPFRDVVKGVGQVLAPFPDVRYGTVHTAQGKEAEVVVLVLGGDPQKPGAKHWAASRPNLLNVAVSRAKRRLYVIGDRAAWSQHRYFDILDRALPDGIGPAQSASPDN